MTGMGEREVKPLVCCRGEWMGWFSSAGPRQRAAWHLLAVWMGLMTRPGREALPLAMGLEKLPEFAEDVPVSDLDVERN